MLKNMITILSLVIIIIGGRPTRQLDENENLHFDNE